MKKAAIFLFLTATLLMFSVGWIIPAEYNFIVYPAVFIIFIAGVYCSLSIESDTK
ncbi:hypothetical protein BN1048_02139 [Jeotgalicoccus saudimassiliensis]|uniref:Uncharacterized protein n=1 Tax=Jeotgalicoccus saudimassiliensis TaxID=1461582 RepID=A0A078M840_9STAP|nr:hypothetical protein [Jeotgalicoccus saudimassiliensis]CEA03588.1 hypothetical protein BN1048_02139 [Jeotgalicoccus saudimassiliensis]